MNLSADVEAMIQQAMARSSYADENELLRRALEALREQDEIDEGIQQGLDDVAAGRVRPWREVIDDTRKRHDLPREQ
jgi:predicted transcriptional regulator